MKKVLCFIDSLGAGGAQRQMVGLARMLSNAGYDILFLYYQDETFFVPDLDKCGIRHARVNNDKGKIGLFFKIYKSFKKYKPDVVISYLESPSIIACLIKLLGQKYKLIVSERATNISFGLRDRVRFQAFRIANWVVPNSYSQERFIRNNASYLSKKLITITNFCSYLSIVPFNKTRNEVPEILIAASIWPIKNTLGFIKAVKILKDQDIPCHISWYGKVGETDYYKQCCDLIKDLDVADKIQLLDKTNNLEEVYRNADYFCLSSYSEGTPNVICEAICMNLPVICSAVGDNGVFVHEGENGFLFDPNDPECIAKRIKEAVNLDYETYHQYCQQSRKIAESLLAEDVFTEKYIKLIEHE